MHKSSINTVLVISYLYPPSREVGAIRVAEFVKYLPASGWQPIVVTSREGLSSGDQEAGSTEIHRTRSMLLERLMDWFRQSGKQVGPYKFSPDTGIVQSSNRLGLLLGRAAIVWLRGWWAVKAVPLALRLARQHRVQVIYVNCGPFGQTLTGWLVHLLTHCPVIFDFRDAWSLDPYGQFSWLGRIWSRLWESFVLRAATQLIVTSPSAKQAYAERYPWLAARMTLIMNGYDEAIFANLKPARPAYPAETLAYAGTIYPKRLRAALEALCQTPTVTLHLYGRIFESESFWQLVQNFNLTDRVLYHGFLARKEVLSELLRSQVLLVTQDYQSRSQVTPIAGKTFEYLRLGKPILGLVPPGDNAEILKRAAASAVVTQSSPEKISAALTQLLMSKPMKKSPGLEEFSRERLTQSLAELFDRVIDN